MLRNHLRIFMRHTGRHKLYAIINIMGLAIGMAACILILLFVQDEVSYDGMHDNADRIYRVLTIDKALGTNNQRVGITMPALGPAISAPFSQVEDALRLTYGGQTLLRYQDRPSVYAKRLRTADANFFDFFDFPLLSGDPATALVDPYSIVLTETLAQQLFGDENPLGEVIQDGSGSDITVTGILRDLPHNTHLEFDALGSMSTIISQAQANLPEGSTQPIWPESWQMIAMPTYARLVEGASEEGLDELFTRFVRDNGVSENFDITLQPLLNVHLSSTDIIFDPVENKGDMNNVYIFAAIAFLILLIAVVNYMNLATARSTDRAKEVGIRKVVGSARAQLVSQFLSESMLTTILALLLALIFAGLAVPWLNQLSGANLSIYQANNRVFVVFLLSLIITVGLLAGLYPALALANFKPITVLKGIFRSGKQGRNLRIGLVVFQFALTIALIGATAIVQKQLNFIQTKDLGYQREQVMVFDMLDQTMEESIETYREALLQHSAFSSAAVSGNVPGRTFSRTRVRPEGVSEEDIWIWSALSVSPETVPTLGMEIVQGRNFSRTMGTDSSGVVLVNEMAIRQLGWEDPLQKRLYFGTRDSVGTEIVGVVKDFHFIGMHQNIEPVVIFPLDTNPGSVLTARIQPNQIKEALAFAERKWQEVYADYPFTYTFLDDEFNSLYQRDLNTGRIVNLFSGLAIFIACLGLFGLTSHATTQRTKEIGIRKVMGASSGVIVRLLVLDFVRWVVLANLFAWPLAWYVSTRWLEGIAYRVDVDFMLLLFASAIGLLVSILTVLGQSWRAAVLNPARALRYE